MPAPSRASRFEKTGTCPRNCSFNAAQLGEEDAIRVHGLLEAYPTEQGFAEAAAAADLGPFSRGSFFRHRSRHLKRVSGAGAPPPEPEEDVSGLTHLQILEKLILQGAKSLPSAKVGSRDLMEAMKLYYQLTKGSAFADFEEALAIGEDDESDTGEEVAESSE